MQADQKSWTSAVGGQWLVLAAAILWGTTGTAQALAPTEASPASIGAVRLAVGGLALLALIGARGGLRDAKRLPFRPTLIAAIGIAAYQLCFFAAVTRTGVAVGTIVGIGSAPVLAGAFAWLINREKPGRRWLAATLLAVFGCMLLIAAGGRISSVDTLGVLLALGAGFFYAVYTLASKDLLGDHPPDTVMAIIFAVGAVFLLPLLITGDLSWLTQPRGLLVAIHLGVITVALAYILFGRGLMTVAAATAVTLTLAEPLTAATLGVVVLGERLTPWAMVGIGLLLAGLALLSLGKNR